jgi:hypothetical protein
MHELSTPFPRKKTKFFVMPAEAGIQVLTGIAPFGRDHMNTLDSRIRGNDDLAVRLHLINPSATF